MSRKRRKREEANKPPQPPRAAELPPGAVWANPAEQVPWGSYDAPPRYYVDIDFTCVDCEAVETWTAEQQKWYYEVAKGELYERAIQCHECRRWRREFAPRGDIQTMWSNRGVWKQVVALIEPLMIAAGFTPPTAERRTGETVYVATRGESKLEYGVQPSGRLHKLFLRVFGADGVKTLSVGEQMPDHATRLNAARFEAWAQRVRQAFQST